MLDVTSSIRLKWDELTDGLRSSWSDFTALFSGAWDAVVGTMMDVWNVIAHAVTATINDIHEAYSWATGGDYTAGADNSDDQNKRDKADADRRKIEMDKEAAREKAVADEKKAREDKTNAEKSSLQKEKDDLQKQLDALKGKATTEKKIVDDKAKADADKQDKEDNQGDNLPSDKGTGKAIGLFNIAGLQGLNVSGGHTQQDRIAKATEETAKNTAKQPTGVAAAHKAYMDDLKKQNASDSTYSKFGRTEISDAKNNHDGTYNVHSQLTGITATLTQGQIALIQQKLIASPVKGGADVDAQMREAVRRRHIMTHQTPNVKGVQDEHGATIAKNTTDTVKYLQTIANNLPMFT